MIRRLSAGPSALLKTTIITAFLLAASVAGAETPVSAEQAKIPATTPDKDSAQVGFHDLICKPNGTEDSFDCADEATPAKIVPIPSQVSDPLPQNQAISG